MEGQKLIIKFDGKFGYLTDDKALPFHQLKLPENAQKRGFKANTVWELEILKYIPSDKRIFVKITSYNPLYTSFFSFPLSNNELEKIEKINFDHINTTELIHALNPNPASTQKTKDQAQHKPPLQLQHKIPVIEKKILEESFFISFKHIQFKKGHVLFEKKITGYGEPILFKIENEHILEAFDAIKDYFVKVCKTPKAKVEAVVEVLNGEATVLEVYSEEIQRINEQLIEQVRISVIRSFLKKNNKDNQGIITPDEFFSNSSEGKIQTNNFYESETAFFDEFIKDPKCKAL